jgi:hypothetical protein
MSYEDYHEEESYHEYGSYRDEIEELLEKDNREAKLILIITSAILVICITVVAALMYCVSV